MNFTYANVMFLFSPLYSDFSSKCCDIRKKHRTIKKLLMVDYLVFAVYSSSGVGINFILKHAHVACDCIRLFDLCFSFFLLNKFGYWNEWAVICLWLNKQFKFCINTTWLQWPLQKRPFLVISCACSLSNFKIYISSKQQWTVTYYE